MNSDKILWGVVRITGIKDHIPYYHNSLFQHGTVFTLRKLVYTEEKGCRRCDF